jgi:predicted nucleic acid-binding protein
MIFDTDVLIWVQKGNVKAESLVNRTLRRRISVQTYMELLQCAENKQQQKYIRDFLSDFSFATLPLTPTVGQLAAKYVEAYSLSFSMRAGDAIIAATAVENRFPLCTANVKHFKAVAELDIRAFSPV